MRSAGLAVGPDALLRGLLDCGAIGVVDLHPLGQLAQRAAQPQDLLDIAFDLEGALVAAVGNSLERQRVEVAQLVEFVVGHVLAEEAARQQLLHGIVGDGDFEDGRGDLLQVVRLVEDVDGRRRNEPFAGKAEFERVEQQVMVGDDHLGLGRLVAHVVDPAVVVIVAAVGVQTVVGKAHQARSQIRPEHEGEFVDVARGGLAEPVAHGVELRVGLVVERDVLLLLALLVHLHRADVVANAP